MREDADGDGNFEYYYKQKSPLDTDWKPQTSPGGIQSIEDTGGWGPASE